MTDEQEYRRELRHRRRSWMRTEVELGSPQPSTQLRESWGEWLSSFPWCAWGTLTFGNGWTDVTHDQLQRAWGRFTTTLVAEGESQLFWFVGHEVGSQGRAHMHCLMGGLQLQRTSLWRWWHERYGRCELRGYDPEKGAAHYVTKYVAKELAHYDLDLGGLDRWQRERRRQARRAMKNSTTRRASADSPELQLAPTLRSDGGPSTMA